MRSICSFVMPTEMNLSSFPAPSSDAERGIARFGLFTRQSCDLIQQMIERNILDEFKAGTMQRDQTFLAIVHASGASKTPRNNYPQNLIDFGRSDP